MPNFITNNLYPLLAHGQGAGHGGGGVNNICKYYITSCELLGQK